MKLRMMLAACVCALVTGGVQGADAPEGAMVQVKVNAATTHQTIQGFGTCYIDWTRNIRREYQDPAFLDLIVNDLGLSIVRQQMQDELEPVNDDDDPRHFNWDGFKTGDVGTGWSFAQRMWFMEELKKRGVKRFIMSPWSPPAFMKTHQASRYGGYLRADMIDEYAEYMAANIILAKKNHGIDIGYITVQNELLFVEPYHSCIYNPYILREAVRALMRKFEREGITTKILMPEDMMFVDRMLAYIGPTMADPETSAFPGGFCTHRQGGFDEVRKWHEATKQYGREDWMTETSGHAQTWAGAMKMASDMHDYLVGGNFSAWIYWQITDTARSHQYALMIEGDPARSPKYHAAKHFYRYVRPGAVRLESASSDARVLASAYRHDVDGTLTLVLINNGDEPVNVQLPVDAVKQFAVYRSSETEKCEAKGTVEAGTPLPLPAKSIVTLQGQSDALKTREQIEEWPEAWQAPAGAGEAKWGVAEGDALKVQHVGNTLTPLHQAILAGRMAEIEKLLEAGADVNAAAHGGWTPLHMAASTYSYDRSNPERVLSKYDIFKRVLDAKPDLRARTADGWTALHAAAANANTAWQQQEQANVQRIADLVAAGIDVNAKDSRGRTALHWAAWQGYNVLAIEPLIVETLLKNGADVNLADDLGRTPLHYALLMGYEPIAQALLKAGANAEARDKAGLTPDALAKERVPHEQVQLRVTKTGTGKLGAELLRAAWDGDIAKVKALLAQDADVHYMDSDGFRAVDRARDNGHTEIVKLLREAAAK